ncbi:cdc42 effector protein 4a [Anguilla anguilla]|uniref:cdc42 effector protein 4a n=1 Tax=Anguilla anguilla TaxID=7936 RepID=UPI0015B0055D|nr:cdc42 effector protein 4a [Anguilla anguilla]XP_035253845.1 cdc42 effector protein 4a [Anguilla anguilla]XP_035253848.1 cdc42 effector protein 4a [Anguilla anguilla]XP_035253849.1 cdc42 effector protein 4a [Anguilla anguilla]XP_035253850.1 cdc42 effector protein 4a [Anguilla anguilla]
MPILKQLVSGSSQSKRRSRLDLTTEMISAPLGDFRHTMHVGRGGDTFGDTSFLSSRSGEPPRVGEGAPRSPRPSLLSRTFRTSKRSQSVTRVDRCSNPLAPLAGSPTLVKNAFSLPHLNDEGGERGRESRGRGGVPKSLSSSPVMELPSEADGTNGTAALDPEQAERSFGELTDLPVSMAPRGCGAMRRTESVMSFHVDLGPSMLGDILDVMEKEDDGLGGEEEGTPPPLDAQDEGDEEEDNKEEDKEEEEGEGDSQEPTVQPPITENVENPIKGPCTPETQPTHPENHHLDTCSVSSSASTPLEEIPPDQPQGGETDCTKFSPTQGEEESFSFMEEEEDDEIRV